MSRPRKVSVISRHPSHKQFDFPMFDKRIRLRFGSTTEFRARKDIDFPSKEAIKNTSNKWRMKKLFAEHGVKSPVYSFFDPIKWKTMIETGNHFSHDHVLDLVDGKIIPKFELIFKELNHSRGEGIHFVSSHEDILKIIENGKKGYVEQVIDNHREFRVHVCDGNAFYVDEKLPREEGHTARIKNLANGYKYRNRSISRPYPAIIKEESIKAVEALGIEFGAVDVCIGEAGTVNVFEVNSAMGLRTKTREKYREQLINLFIKKGANIIES